ncbi:MAG: DUF6544 family protein [Candidatus Velthaea sp.]
MNIRAVLGLSFAGAVAVVGMALVAGSIRWGSVTSRLAGKLERSSHPERAQANVVADQYAALPVPVERYFKYALSPSQKWIYKARLQQNGLIRAAAGADRKPFTAVQHFLTNPVGFVWDAKSAMMPFLSVSIRDAYVDGVGASEASIAGLISVGKQGGTPQVASGSLLRYLAESAWIPTALLPQSGVYWTGIDDTHARATLNNAGTSVTMEVTFAESGQLVRINATRYRDIDGTPVPTPWSGDYTDYQRIDGMMIPTSAEVAWSPPSGRFAVWRSRISAAEYEFR